LAAPGRNEKIQSGLTLIDTDQFVDKTMKVDKTDFEELIIIEPDVFFDDRGYFMESYNYNTFKVAGIRMNFVQDNQTLSKRGVVRGLHFQNEPYAQTKLVRVISGSILDVVVDLRRHTATFGKHFAIELSAENRKQLLVPKGFAHGFSVLSETAVVLYKCDEFYHPEAEGGILYNDPNIGIDWGLPDEELILSGKDKINPTLDNATFKF
jgi:dTDP-4-dehydrorhamnose 3,5-epimerase